jgi:hypothetical protein
MYIGLGTIVVILAVVIIVMMMRTQQDLVTAPPRSGLLACQASVPAGHEEWSQPVTGGSAEKNAPHDDVRSIRISLAGGSWLRRPESK